MTGPAPGQNHILAALPESERTAIGMKTNAQSIYMLLLSHAHEHLGQSVAYARSNGIAPPWTAVQNEAFRARMEKAGAVKG